EYSAGGGGCQRRNRGRRGGDVRAQLPPPSARPFRRNSFLAGGRRWNPLRPPVASRPAVTSPLQGGGQPSGDAIAARLGGGLAKKPSQLMSLYNQMGLSVQS